MNISESIKFHRNRLKMSQEYVADQLGVSRQAVSKWETGQSEPTARNLADLAMLYDISLSELAEPERYEADIRFKNKVEQQKHQHNRHRIARLLGYILATIGYTGFSEYYAPDLKMYWFAVSIVGIVLIALTSNYYYKKQGIGTWKIILFVIWLLATVLLPRIITASKGINVLVGHIVAFGAISILNIKYWKPDI